MNNRALILAKNPSSFRLVTRQLENSGVILECHNEIEAFVSSLEQGGVGHVFVSSESNKNFISLVHKIEFELKIPVSLFTETQAFLEMKRIKDSNWNRVVRGKVSAERILSTLGINSKGSVDKWDEQVKESKKKKKGDFYVLESDDIRQSILQSEESKNFKKLAEYMQMGMETLIKSTIDEFGDLIKGEALEIDQVQSIFVVNVSANNKNYYIVSLSEKSSSFNNNNVAPIVRYINDFGKTIFNNFSANYVELPSCSLSKSEIVSLGDVLCKYQSYYQNTYVDYYLFQDKTNVIENTGLKFEGESMFKIPARSFDIDSKMKFDIYIYMAKNAKFIPYISLENELSHFQKLKVKDQVIDYFYIKEVDVKEWKSAVTTLFLERLKHKVFFSSYSAA